MIVTSIQQGPIEFFVEQPEELSATAVRLIWLHGWGQDRRAFAALAPQFSASANNYLVDLPGFGQSPPPPEAWSSLDYANSLADWLRQMQAQPTILIGHSLGCRVSLQLAKHYPELVQGMCLIAAAGLQKKPSAKQKLRVFTYKTLAKLARLIDSTLKTQLLDKLRDHFGSKDYRNAKAMRGTLVKIVNEDLASVASVIKQPTVLIYGEQDTETPVAFGQRFAALLSNSELLVLPHFDHWSILTSGYHQVATQIKKYLGKNFPRG